MENYSASIDPEINRPIEDAEIDLEALDKVWYEKFVSIGSFEPAEYFSGRKNQRDIQKEKFLNDEIDHPQLKINIPLQKIYILDTKLREFKKEIIDSKENELVRSVYRWKINEKIAQLGMMKAAVYGDMRRFERYNSFIYGEPSEEIFSFTVNNIRKDALGEINSDNSELSEAARDLLQFYPKKEESKISYPDEETISYASQTTREELGDIVDIESFEGRLDASAIAKIFNQAIEKIGAKDEWRVVVDSMGSKKAISVSQEKKQAIIPSSRQLEEKRLQGLIAHEIGTHMQRRINGERSKLMLLGLGLDRYISGEEGVSTMRQQVIEKGSIEEYAGLNYHLGISFARGLDGKKRNFHEVFDLLTKKNYLYNLRGGESIDQARKSARETAYNSCVRIFRGTDCMTKGVCFSKDLAYREGNIGVFALISTEKGKEEMMRFNIGKYDPSNQRHCWILDQLGISDEDIKTLENPSI